MIEEITVEIQNAPTISVSAAIMTGPEGMTAYESYLATTDDDPPLSEAEWSAPPEGGGTELTSYATQIATLDDYPTSFPTTTADITDATSDGATNPSKVLKTDANGVVTVTQVNASTINVAWNAFSVDLTAQTLTDDRAQNLPDANGTLAITSSDTGVPDALANGTISGTLAFNSTSITFGTGALLALQNAMGFGPTGRDLSAAATPAAAAATLQIGPKVTAASTQDVVSSTTFVDDAELAFTGESGADYNIEFCLQWSGGSFKARCYTNGTATAIAWIGNIESGASSANGAFGSTYVDIRNSASASGVIMGTIRIRNCPAGTIKIMWAQNSASGTTTRAAGSYWKPTKI